MRLGIQVRDTQNEYGSVIIAAFTNATDAWQFIETKATFLGVDNSRFVIESVD